MSDEQKTFSNDGAASDGAASNGAASDGSSDGQTSVLPTISPREPLPADKPWTGELSLPSIPDTDDDGSSLVSRVVGYTLGFVGLLATAALVVAGLIHVDVTVDAPGTLDPQTVWPVRAQEAGTIASMHVASGDTVSRGHVLARLDSMHLLHERARLQANLASQRLALARDRASDDLDAEQQQYTSATAQATLIRSRADLRDRLAAHGLASDVDSVLRTYEPGQHVGIDRAISDLKTAQARVQTVSSETGRAEVRRLDRAVKRAELNRITADLRNVETRLSRLRLTSPADGVVLTDRLEQLHGQYVQPGDLLFEVAALDGWRAHLYVGEQDVHEIEPGDPVKLEVRAFRDSRQELLPATVAAVAASPVPAGQAVQGGRYRVTVRLDAEAIAAFGADRLRQGYRVDGNVITNSGRALTLLWEYLVGTV